MQIQSAEDIHVTTIKVDGPNWVCLCQVRWYICAWCLICWRPKWIVKTNILPSGHINVCASPRRICQDVSIICWSHNCSRSSFVYTFHSNDFCCTRKVNKIKHTLNPLIPVGTIWEVAYLSAVQIQTVFVICINFQCPINWRNNYNEMIIKVN